jgi:hypothetical protein
MLETLNDIFYRMYYYNIIISGGIEMIGKIVVQMDTEYDA